MLTKNRFYRPHTEYDGKVMFSVCLFTGGAPQTGGRPRGNPPNWGGRPPTGGAPRGTPQLGGAPGVTPLTRGGAPGVPPQLGGYPPNKFGLKCWTKFGTKNGQSFGQKMDNILDKKLGKHFGNFWRWRARAVRLLRSRRRTVLSYLFSVGTKAKTMDIYESPEIHGTSI